MKKIAIVYTGLGNLPNEMDKLFKRELGPEIKLDHIIDSGLIWDMVAAGGLTASLERRLTALYDAAAETGADLILGSCSSIGDFTERYGKAHPERKLLRIDYPMAKYAAQHGRKIVVMATLETTVTPSAELIARLASAEKKEIEIVPVTVRGAIEKLMAGQVQEAAALVAQSAREHCGEADVVVLAQASMGAFRQTILDALAPGTILLESPATCADYLKTLN